MANEKQDDENLTVSKVYETLKSGPYLKKLYWDVLSDIKEKDTFKQMRETTEKLLNKKSEALANLSDSESDNLQRKTIVAEICSMTYAIDTVYSKILYVKLQKEFKSHIVDAIKALRQERKIPDSVWSKLKISDDPEVKDSSESITTKSIPHQKKPETSSRPVRSKRHKLTPAQLAAKNIEIRSEIHKDLKAIKISKPGNQAAQKKQTSTSAKTMPSKKQIEENQAPSKLNTEEVVSDAESEISVGHVSLDSVSSVHTSDLSSFDDEISLSSEEEDNGGKKRFSLKELKEMCNSGRLSEKFNGSMLKNASENLKSSGKKADAKHGQEIESSPVRIDNAPEDSAGSSTDSKSPTQKELPKRIRKPNSKYSSDNMVCTVTKVKERKKQPNVRNEKNSSHNTSAVSATPLVNRKRARNGVPDSEGEIPIKIVKTFSVKEEVPSTEENETKPDVASLSRQLNSPEAYSPHFAVRSLTSRKSAPVTLFST